MKTRLPNCVFVLSLLEVVVGVMYVTTHVRQRGTCAKDECDGYMCKDDHQCMELDENMICVCQYCVCKEGYTRVGDKCSPQGKKVGEDCMSSEDCAESNGYCNMETHKCECPSTMKEWEGECYKGYKALLDDEFEINVPYMSELSFCVSERNDPWQIYFSDMEHHDDDSYRFYEENSYTSDSGPVDSKELEIVLDGSTGGGVPAPPDVDMWKIVWGDRDFTLKIYKYAPDGTLVTPAESEQNKDEFKLVPEILTVTREEGTTDFIFYPLSHDVSLVYGYLGDVCEDDDDCKMEHTVCMDGMCVCADMFTEYHGCCIEDSPDVGGHCIEDAQCMKNYTVCEYEECVCQKYYFMNDAGDCVMAMGMEGDPCTKAEECKGYHMICEEGMCMCEHGYVYADGKCFKEAHLGDPCSCVGQCVDNGTYCHLKPEEPTELGVCRCFSNMCEFDGKCHPSYMVYPTTRDKFNTYNGRNFSAMAHEEMYFMILAPPEAGGVHAPGKFSVHPKSGDEEVHFMLDYQDGPPGSTVEVEYPNGMVGPDPITVILDPSANFLTHIKVDPITLVTKNAMGMTQEQVMEAGEAINPFDSVLFTVERGADCALPFCTLDPDILPMEGSVGDFCDPMVGCPDLDHGQCNSVYRACECEDGFIPFYGKCIEIKGTGGTCIALLQCDPGFCDVTGTCT